ncbi:hypothetical protein AB0D30_30890 [Streptomyces sp. NPDC048409]|uniref:COG1470 family protein n=1 Tax=Streptomyces sp. NPDC048409 TaxID=3154723 RepID=UPI00343487BA
MGATVLMQEYDSVAQPGEASRCTVQILNTGPVVDRFELDIVGAAADWITVEPSQVSAFPYEMAEATVVFSPPRSFDVLAGTQTYALRVMSQEDVEGSVVDEATVTVAPYVDYSLRCAPATRRGRLGGRYSVVVGNKGNSPLPVRLFAEDADSALRYRFRHEEVDVPPGRGVVVPLKVRPRARKWRGTDSRHAVQCLAAAGGGERRTAELTWVQAPVLAPGVGQFLMASFAAVTALAALWYLVLRPTVSSEATRQLGGDTAAQDGGSEGSSGGDGSHPSAGSSSGSHNSPSPGPSSSTAGTGGAKKGSAPSGPADVRLAADVPISDKFDTSTRYKVPKGSRLTVNSVFLENTANDVGIIRIQRDDSTLREFNLDSLRNNPRSLDGTFVIEPGQSLVLAVQCVKPGALPGQAAAAACTPAATFSGNLTPVQP